MFKFIKSLFGKSPKQMPNVKPFLDRVLPPHLRMEDALRTSLDTYRSRAKQLENEIDERQRELESIRLCEDAVLAAIKLVNVPEPGALFGGVVTQVTRADYGTSYDTLKDIKERETAISIEDELEREFLTNGK